MPDTTETKLLELRLLELNRPGIVIEVDSGTAADLGAFEEDALTEEDALASAEIDVREAH